MKRILTGTILTFGVLIFMSSFTRLNNQTGDAAFVIPDNINKTLQNSCYGCHNSESKNSKAKLKLKIDELSTMKKSKRVSKLSKIYKILEKGKMPPKKFVAKYPEKALNDDQKKELIDWAKSTATGLAGE